MTEHAMERPFEGLIIMLARLDPADQPDAHGRVQDALRYTFPECDIASFECLGRYDGMYLIRVPDLDFRRTDRVTHFDGLKKLDVQYGYLDARDCQAFWGSIRSGALPPLTLFSYLRIRDHLNAHSQRSIVEYLREKTRDMAPACVIRCMGWPDCIVVACHNDASRLVEFARKDLWELSVGELGGPASGEAPAEEVSRNDPVFSRTYTVLGFSDRARLSRVRGEIHAPRVNLRLRAGSHGTMGTALASACDKWEWGDARCEAVPVLRLQLGADDATIDFSPFEERAGTGAVQARKLLPWYRNHFLADPVGRARADTHVTDLVTTSELVCSAIPTPCNLACPEDRDDYRVPLIEPPEALVRHIEENSILLAQPVASSIRSLARTLNWAMTNEGIRRDFVDQAVHTRAFFNYVQASMTDEGFTSGLLQTIGTHSALAGHGFAQRLAGCYYDLCSDSPEIVLEYSGGIQKVLGFLYAVQHMFFETVCAVLHRDDPPEAYWVIAKEGFQAETVIAGRAVTFLLSSSLAFDPARAAYHVTHEMCHLVWRQWTRALPMIAPTMVVEDQVSGLVLPERLHHLVAAFSKGIFGPGHTKTFTRLLLELVADAMTFMLLNGDLERHKRIVGDMLACGAKPLMLVYVSWVIEALAEALDRLGWNGEGRLADFLIAVPGPLGIGEALWERRIAPPSLITPAGMEDGDVSRLCVDAWQAIVELGLNTMELIFAAAEVVEHARFLVEMLDTEGSTLRRAMDLLMGLGGTEGMRMSPVAGEGLAAEALSRLRAVARQV